MPYVSKAQIASEAKIGRDFGADTQPTADKVDEIIAEVEALIDATIGRKYALPVSGAASLLIVRSISIALCTERVRAIMDSSEPIEEGAADPSKPQKLLAKDARGRLKAIVDGDLPLAGMTLISTKDGIRSYAVSNGCEPFFKRGVEQW